MVERIRTEGDDPAEYVDIAFRVPERKYTAWPNAIRAAFEDARTVKTGKPVFKLSLARGGRVMSGLPIISADERLAERRGIKGCIFGTVSGIGKTSLLWTLEPAATLFFDLEAGDLAIEGWKGDTIRPRTWSECRDFAVFIGGPNPALRDDQVYSRAHYEAVAERLGDPAALDQVSRPCSSIRSRSRAGSVSNGARANRRRSPTATASPTCAAPTDCTARR